METIHESNKKPVLLTAPNESLKTQTENVLQRASALKEYLESHASPVSILAILKENPCLLKCVNEIQHYHYENDIDSLYSGRHDWVRKRIIEGIIDRFEDLILVSSEHGIINGKLDVAVFPDKIRLKYGRRLIAIEIKTGRWVDSSLFNQIERYLSELDVLIVVRVSTEDVVAIESAPLRDILAKNLDILTRKSHRIMSGKRIRIPGDWCKGCSASCEFKKPARWSGKGRNASLDGYEDFARQTETIIEKILMILHRLFELEESETIDDALINESEADRPP